MLEKWTDGLERTDEVEERRAGREEANPSVDKGKGKPKHSGDTRVVATSKNSREEVKTQNSALEFLKAGQKLDTLEVVTDFKPGVQNDLQ